MCRLQTPQLEETLKDFPLYSQDGKEKDAVCRAIFVLGSARWFILEGNREGDDTIMFGIVIGLIEDEYGYVSLNELSDIELDLIPTRRSSDLVTKLTIFHPRTLSEINDIRLYHFLARFEN